MENTKNEINRIIKEKNAEIQTIIGSEIENIPSKMREANNDITIPRETLQNKINNFIDKIKNEINEQFSKLINELKEIGNEFNKTNNNIQLFDINTFIGFDKNI